ncbi:MAG: hypothetical protein ACTHOF_17575, partial [Flavisolibacter sp.]
EFHVGTRPQSLVVTAARLIYKRLEYDTWVQVNKEAFVPAGVIDARYVVQNKALLVLSYQLTLMVTLNFWKVQFQTPNSGVRSPDFPKVVYDIPETFGKFNFIV